MTPYEQAKYYDNGLPRSEKARWIVTSNFDEIWVYDMEKRKPEEDVIKIYLKDLDKEYHMLLFLFDPQVEQIRRELKVSQEAGDRIGRVYDALLALYPGEPTEEEYKSLNLFCVRLVFCYYAEDAGLFNKYQFRDYVASFNPKHLRNGLKDLFRILDTKEDERDRTEEPELLAFPYVNGGLFADRNIIVPQIDEKTQSIMTETSDFNWSEISPTIFGAVFESTLNQETRRKGGMHYTSIENIHKVIDPLFLNNLKEEYKSISESKQPNIKRQRLQDFQNKLGTLKFLDPACGSGNFLTETYLSLRRMENEVIKNIIELDKTVFDKQIALGELGSANSVIKVSLSQFYGIEINDFAVSVAKTALWIAESQMLNETSAIVYHNIDFLPLKSYVNIIEGNALQLTWNDILSPNDCSYIMGNPPFVGHRNVSPEQKEDMIRIFSGKQGRLDYVSAWYAIAADYISGTEIECAFVSTNTVVQGTHIQTLWNKLIESNVIINFAHRTFVWDSEASQKAHVHCVIIGFSKKARVNKTIYDGEEQFAVQTITPYLTDGENDVIVKSASVPLCKNVPKMIYGNIPRDGGFYTFNSKEEVDEFVKSEPSAKSLIHKFIGGREFINNIDRWFLFLEDSTPSELKAMKNVMDRISKVRDFRLSSKAKEIQKFAQTPTKLAQHTQPIGVDYIAVPIVSSSRREYVPIGYVDGDTITNNQVQIIPYASVYHFGILCSSIHNDWMRKTCGRLKSDYRYSRDLVYNTFPWPNPTTEQIVRIEQTADAILEARALYPNSSLADLYDPLTMPPELRKAHDANDKAVMKAYGFSPDIEEPEIVAELMKMYQKLTEEK
jgi:type I restriction-modification system DNA methylase subunit